MDTPPLTQPRYTQPEVLAVTKLRPATLQTWVNRGILQLAEQNPGYGRRRRYSKLDVVKLAIMRRIGDLRIDIERGVKIATACEERLLAGQDIAWGLLISIRPDHETAKKIVVEHLGGDGLTEFNPITGDTRNMRVSDFLEPFESVLSRRDRPALGDPDRSRPINPDRRTLVARMGWHAEPVILFPVGEIVNGTLEQLRTLDEGEA